jgi:phage gpG-like protein
MFTIELKGDRELIQRLNAMPANVRTALKTKITALALLLEAKVKDQKLSGQVLNVQSGALRRSIFGTVTDTDTSITAKVGSAGDVKYAGLHEYGGTTAAHVIEPSKAQALAFVLDGKQAFFKRVHHPGSRMPERSYLRSSLDDMRTEIVEGMRQAVLEGLSK